MKTLARNKQVVWYALASGKTEIIDENGFRTGQYKVEYEKPVKTRMNIRWDDSAVRLEGFGLNGSGRRRLVTDDMNCPITLGTILWIAKVPELVDENAIVDEAEVDVAEVGNDDRLAELPNYYVCQVPQKSLTQIVYVVEEVNVGKAFEKPVPEIVV